MASAVVSGFLQPDERSISTWQTEEVGREEDGRVFVKVTDGSGGNSDLVGRVFQVVRKENGGQKTILTLKLPVLSHWLPLQPNERSISTWKTEQVSQGKGGRFFVEVTNGSDGNHNRVGRVFEVVRKEYGGQKIIFKN